MKLTNETLRQHYLQDLQLPDIHHGRSTPKVRYMKQWKAITPHYAHGSPITIDPWKQDVWVWSDTHFGHNNIIGYTGRPYPNVDMMNQCLIGNYANVVKPNDIVIWNGDIGFKSENTINQILSQLPGYKIQVVGNHDIKRDGTLSEYVVDERHLCYVIDVVDAEMELQLLFTHYPLDHVPKGCVNVHGHIHQNTANAWNINVCVEHTNYSPVNLRDVINRAKTYIRTHS